MFNAFESASIKPRRFYQSPAEKILVNGNSAFSYSPWNGDSIRESLQQRLWVHQVNSTDVISIHQIYKEWKNTFHLNQIQFNLIFFNHSLAKMQQMSSSFWAHYGKWENMRLNWNHGKILLKLIISNILSIIL